MVSWGAVVSWACGGLLGPGGLLGTGLEVHFRNEKGVKYMKKAVSIMVAGLMILGLAACGGAQDTTLQASADTAVQADDSQEALQNVSDDTLNADANTDTDKSSDAGVTTTEADADNGTVEDAAGDADTENAADNGGAADGKTLVVYFSATGNTREVAEKIAAITGADIYEIVPAQEYTTEDLDWNNRKSRSIVEQNDRSARPEIGSDAVSLEGYTTIYIGYPIWCAIEPRIMDTFVESYNFDGITMIPFCTSGSSGIGSSGKNLAKAAGTGNWLDGRRFAAGATEDTIKSWIDGLE